MIKSKPEIPIFEQILVEKTDSSEIKKFIRKVNYDMLGYSCNHNSIDEKVNKVYNNAINIYNTEEYHEYKSFIDISLIPVIMDIIDTDKDGKIYDINHYEKDDEIDYSFGIRFPTKPDIQRIVNDVIIINGMIADNNAQTNKHCSKCEAAIRRYKYSVFEINRMREELKEQLEIDQNYVEKPAENKYDIKTFLQNNFPSIDKFPLSEVRNKYKITFKMNITNDELRKQIENTKMFKISNIHNVLFVRL